LNPETKEEKHVLLTISGPNPGGNLPIWIVNKANSISLPDLWKAVKRRIKNNKNN
jgi:hypothetical protein